MYVKSSLPENFTAHPFKLRRKPAITAEDIARECVAAAADKKAENIVVLDLRGISTFTDYYVICSGGSEAANQGDRSGDPGPAAGRFPDASGSGRRLSGEPVGDP